jgi:hypothetical protein
MCTYLILPCPALPCPALPCLPQVNKHRGANLPIMTLHERVLSVLGCKVCYYSYYSYHYSYHYYYHYPHTHTGGAYTDRLSLA